MNNVPAAALVRSSVAAADPDLAREECSHASRSVTLALSLAIASTVALTALTAPSALAQSTSIASVATGGAQGDANSFGSAISADGRFVAFQSDSTTLVASDFNGRSDVFVRDAQAGTTELASLATGGAQADGNCLDAALSGNGRFVAFRALATNLVAGDTNNAADVFVRDRTNATTERASVSTGGVEADGNCYRPSISGDGRFVAFASAATTLVPGDTNGQIDVFVRDRQTATTARVSVSSAGVQSDGPCESPAISADGRFVAFHATATNLVAGGTLGQYHVYVHDRLTGTTELASIGSGGQGNGFSAYCSISGDGRFVAFQSSSTNLVPGDVNFDTDVFVRDRQLATTELASVGAGGVQGNSASYEPAISADGRFVAFPSTASNLVAGDTNGAQDVLVRDRQLGTTTRATVGPAGVEANGNSWYPEISADGRYVVYESAATNLVVADLNGNLDVFRRDRTGDPAPSGFCFGDGSGTPCPCGNSGASGNGCASSVSASGANLASSGTTSLAADTFVLLGSGMPNSSALYFQGTLPINGGAGSVFGDGLRCAGGAIVRLGTKSNAGGASQYPGAGDPSVSVRGQVFAPGTRTYQVWYRNAAAFCTSSTFNLTNGLLVSWSS